MEIEAIGRRVADLVILLLLGTLVLQLFAPAPEPRTYQPPAEMPSSGGVLASQEERNVSGQNYTITHESMERRIFDLVNAERASEGLDGLEWDPAIADVARQHSKALAEENEPLTERDLLCYFPLIHHEGFQSGLYHQDRLTNRSIYYFSSSGENIFVASAWKSRKTFEVDEANCSMADFSQPEGAESVKEELEARLEHVEGLPRVKWLFTFSTKEEIEGSIVQGWMDSPGHRENLLNPDFTHGGMGVAQANDFYFVTQVFIAKVGCGYLGATCCKEEGFYPYCYSPYECQAGVCSMP